MTAQGKSSITEWDIAQKRKIALNKGGKILFQRQKDGTKRMWTIVLNPKEQRIQTSKHSLRRWWDLFFEQRQVLVNDKRKTVFQGQSEHICKLAGSEQRGVKSTIWESFKTGQQVSFQNKQATKKILGCIVKEYY